MPSEVYIYLIPFLALLLVPSFRSEYFGRFDKNFDPVTKPVGRIDFFDYIKGLSILGVVLIHVTYFFDQLDLFGFPLLTINFLNNFWRFAIALFLISSGVLLNPQNLTSAKGVWGFYKRKVVRLLLPYLVLSGLTAYLFFPGLEWGQALYLIFSGKLLVPYYFIVVLFQLYLLYPLLVKLSKLKYFLEFSLILSILSHIIPPLWEYQEITLFFQLLFFFVYGLTWRPFFLGEAKSKNLNWWWLILLHYLLVSLIINDYFYNARYFYGPAVLHLLWAHKDRLLQTFPSRLILFIGRQSLGIYTHFLVVGYLFVVFSGLTWGWRLTLTVASSLVGMLFLAAVWRIGQYMIAKLWIK